MAAASLKKAGPSRAGVITAKGFDLGLGEIIEPMNGTAWDKKGFAWGDVHGFSLDCERQNAFHPVDGLVKVLVEMR